MVQRSARDKDLSAVVVVVVTIQQVCISSLVGERRRAAQESGPVEDAFAAGGGEGLGQEAEGSRRREFVE